MNPAKLKERLFIEQSIMIIKLPHFKLYQLNNEFYFKGWYNTTIGVRYLLKLNISEHYPDKIPELYVLSPKPFWQQGKIDPMNNIQSSHAFHTSNNDSKGNIQICHYDSGSWHAGCTCVGVMTKGQIWCEANAEHLSTGVSIDTIITQWKKDIENGIRKRQIGENN